MPEWAVGHFFHQLVALVPELVEFKKKHGFKLISIASLIQFREPSHRAVFIQNFTDDADRGKSGQSCQSTAASVCPARWRATGFGTQGKDMARLDKHLWRGSRVSSFNRCGGRMH